MRMINNTNFIILACFIFIIALLTLVSLYKVYKLSNTIKGPSGPQGPSGPSGPSGPQWPQGSTGSGQVTSPEENLTIIRGSIASHGSIISGKGFTCSLNQEYIRYEILFTKSFAEPPSITASVVEMSGRLFDINIGGQGVGTLRGFYIVIDNKSLAPFNFIVIGILSN